jgi:hypothetical protein
MWIRILALLALVLSLDTPSGATEPPAPPRLPRDFQWEGRYVVSDLGIDVPFTWHGRDGNLQMVAGDATSAIHFTNILVDGRLYTLTYRWPETVPPPSEPKCVCLGRLTLDTLNACLATARHVGAEILKDQGRRHVHHFRLSVVLGENATKPDPLRIPIMQGDFYVDSQDPSKPWKVLHYGLQNLLDPALDEWIIMESFADTPGEVTLPPACSGTCRGDLFALPLFCR